MLQLRYSFSDDYLQTSIALALFVFILLGFPICQMLFVAKFRDRLKEYEFRSAFGVFYMGLKTQTTGEVIFGALSIFRRLSMVMTLVILNNHSITAMIVILGGYSLLLVYSVIVRPYQSIIDNLIFIIGTGFSIGAFGCLLYNLTNSWEGILLAERERVGQIYVALCLCVFGVYILGSIISFGMFIIALKKGGNKENTEKMVSEGMYELRDDDMSRKTTVQMATVNPNVGLWERSE